MSIPLKSNKIIIGNLLHTDNDKEIFYKSGQRSVVNHLIEKYKIQEE